MNSSTPSDVQLQFRKPDFEFSVDDFPWLGNTMQSHFFHALSVFIPTSERYVSAIIQQQIPKLEDEQLISEAKIFLQQEGRHAYLHKRSNDALIKHYPRLAQFQAWQSTFLALLDRICTNGFRAAIPVSFEHFTANISRHFLKHESQWTQGKHNTYIEFVQWHCMEELEHQAICYDVYRHQFKQQRRIPLTLLMFWLPMTWISIYGVQAYLLFKDKQLRKPQQWWRFLRFTMKSSKLFYGGIFKYLRKDYRPWSEDDLQLYKQSQLKLQNRTKS